VATIFSDSATATAPARPIRIGADSVAAYWDAWKRGDYSSTRSASARAALSELKPQLRAAARCSVDGSELLGCFDDLVRQTMVGAHLFASLAADPCAMQTLMQLVARAPRLTPTIASRPEAFDALIAGRSSGAARSVENIVQGLTAIRAAPSAEQLERIQRFVRKQQFLIGARAVLGWMPIADAEREYSRLAYAAVQEMTRIAERNFQKLHGRFAGCDWALVALGKFGGFELTATSDLDLMLVYEVDDAADMSDGAKPLPTTQYFNLLARTVIATLGARDNDGPLFEVDFRLRPWGNKGPIATQLSTLRDYLDQESWTYEHMAMTRARIVSGAPRLAAMVENVIAEALHRSAQRRDVRADVLDMHLLLHTAKPTGNVWDIKHIAGGLIDIEFVAQYLMLRHNSAEADLICATTADAFDLLVKAGHLGACDRDELAAALTFFKNALQAIRIACLPGPQPETMSNAFASYLPGALGEPNIAAVEAKLTRLQARVRDTFARLTRV
jgi:glutamate-ammonia-ligase adenylyltransferase